MCKPLHVTHSIFIHVDVKTGFHIKIFLLHMYYLDYWNITTKKKQNRSGITTILMLNCGMLWLRYFRWCTVMCKFSTSLVDGSVQFINLSALVH